MLWNAFEVSEVPMETGEAEKALMQLILQRSNTKKSEAVFFLGKKVEKEFWKLLCYEMNRKILKNDQTSTSKKFEVTNSII
jgi:hypothetical protein